MKISIEELRSLVKEELGRHNGLNEDIDHKSANKVVTLASNLFKALETFEKSEPTEEMSAALGDHISGIKKSLEDMIQNPLSYVAKVSSRKVVTFKKA